MPLMAILALFEYVFFFYYKNSKSKSFHGFLFTQEIHRLTMCKHVNSVLAKIAIFKCQGTIQELGSFIYSGTH